VHELVQVKLSSCVINGNHPTHHKVGQWQDFTLLERSVLLIVLKWNCLHMLCFVSSQMQSL